MITFVTGGSRGLGAGIVIESVRAGHDVAFAYLKSRTDADQVVAAALDARPGARCKAYQLDVRDPEHVEQVVDQVVDDFDTIDVLVNNAGINRDNLAVAMSDEEWSDVIATNLTGPFNMIRQVLPIMMGARFGRIINVSSIQHQGGSGQANYAASKAGLHGLTMTIAKEYGRKGITANVVVPGFFDTDMTRESMPEAVKEYWQKMCPMPKGRIGEIRELAQTVTFLASPAAGYINGVVLPVTGGLGWTQ